MRIIYDYQVFRNKVSGASRVICEIANILRRSDDVKILAPFSCNLYYKEIFGVYHPLLSTHYFKGRDRIVNYFSQKLVFDEFKKNNVDIFHPTMESLYYLNKVDVGIGGKTPLIITFHDMIPENYFVNNPRLSGRKTLSEISTRIVCVSNNTKKELLEYYDNIDPNKVSVVYHGISKPQTDYKANIWGEYLLYVGTRNDYKNFLFMVEAIAPLLLKYSDLKLICTGQSFNKEELSLFSRLKVSKQVVNVGFVEDNVLYSLYKYAKTFIFPSLYEGFGIPILEAFVNECPACLANASCFPEIGGDAAIYFDPRDKDSLLDVVTKVLEDNELANQLRKKGTEKAKEFTWEKSASSMRKCYEQAL